MDRLFPIIYHDTFVSSFRVLCKLKGKEVYRKMLKLATRTFLQGSNFGRSTFCGFQKFTKTIKISTRYTHIKENQWCYSINASNCAKFLSELRYLHQIATILKKFDFKLPALRAFKPWRVSVAAILEHAMRY